MYVNKCTKCGCEFETKNPKRVICPSCLYPDKKMIVSADSSADSDAGKKEEFSQPQEQGNSGQSSPQESGQSTDREPQGSSPSEGHARPAQQQFYNSYSQDAPQQRPYNRYDNQGSYSHGGGNYNRPQQGGYNRPQQGGYNQGGYNRPQQGGYNRPQQGGYNQGGYNRPQQGGYNRPQQGGYNQGGYNRPQQGGYNRPQQGGYNQGGYNRPQQGGFNRPQGGYNRPQQGSFNRPQGGSRFGNRPQRPMGNRNKPLLVSKEQLEQIELLYKMMLPLPNPDAHEVIGEKIGLEPRKVFFGINLIRQKMMLPKLPFPKRKLAISPDQMFAIQNLYEPLLPLPPIGCHKIIASQLKMDEWRVHVGIGLIRGKMGLSRWNQEREDAPEEFKTATKGKAKDSEEKEVKKTKKTKEKAESKETEEKVEKPKRGRKPKVVEETTEKQEEA